MTIPEALDLGVKYACAGQYVDACGLFRGVLKHDPENFEAMQRLGSALFERKLYHEALYYFWRGRKIAPRHPLALTNYGLCVTQLGHAEEGVADLERALAQARKDKETSREVLALIYNNLGNAYERVSRYDEAVAALEQAIALKPQDPFPYYNMGISLLHLNRHTEAIALLDKSIALGEGVDNADADAHYNRGIARLLMGDFKGGFADYEYRLTTTENELPNFGLPAAKKWTGEQSIAGKTLLLYCEQGLGDDIQFFRFLRPLTERHKPATIKMVTHSATKILLPADLPISILEAGAELGDYDHWVALMSLPLCLKVESIADIPPPFAPEVEPGRIAHCRFLRSAEKLNVGLCWAGNFQHKNDRHRSIPWQKFSKVLNREANFVVLQQLRPGEEKAFAETAAQYQNMRRVEVRNFLDTAAVILNLDVVVSVDTAVAHLAASLNVPTMVLIPAFGTDWRWQLYRSNSPWYPMAALFRQPKVGDWDTAIKMVKDSLQAMSRGVAEKLGAA